MRRKPVRVEGRPNDGPVDASSKLAGHYAGNDATITSYAGSRESLAMEQVPARAALARTRSDRRFKRLRSENRAPTSATPGAYSQATQFHPSGARY